MEGAASDKKFIEFFDSPWLIYCLECIGVSPWDEH